MLYLINSWRLTFQMRSLDHGLLCQMLSPHFRNVGGQIFVRKLLTCYVIRSMLSLPQRYQWRVENKAHGAG